MSFPLLLIPLAVYNIMVFLMPGVSFAAPVLTVSLVSGAPWAITVGDVLLALAVLLLMLEVIKGARPGGKYLTDHLLSFILLGGAAAEFVLLPQFGSSTYFLLTLLAFVDFVSGIALRARRPRRLAPTPVPAAVPVEPERTAPPVDVPPAAPPPIAPRAPEPAPISAAVEPPPALAPHPAATGKATASEEVPSPMAQGAGEEKPSQSEIRPGTPPERP